MRHATTAEIDVDVPCTEFKSSPTHYRSSYAYAAPHTSYGRRPGLRALLAAILLLAPGPCSPSARRTTPAFPPHPAGEYALPADPRETRPVRASVPAPSLAPPGATILASDIPVRHVTLVLSDDGRAQGEVGA
ncbi:hypothetical protein B0H17DRAFT_1213398 [Mycena rosella]|uniref:Uncharacterized protein n=1 Tax=Mycena rosella TaxID=1033263 RepID=A0AAD7CQ77_MYCRO|nr:hypothetical protein B0H17DRAFT_1213398 [Mycena rosella]